MLIDHLENNGYGKWLKEVKIKMVIAKLKNANGLT
jgi:hypothetical protein